MKILLFSYPFYPQIGGIESTSELLADVFIKAGHEVRVVTKTAFSGTEPYIYEIYRHPSAFKVFKLGLWADLVFETNPALSIAWPTLFANKKRITGLQTWVGRPDGTFSNSGKLKLEWLSLASKVIACSNALRVATFPKATVIGNPYDDNVFRRLPGVTVTKDFVFLGRLVSDKGVALAIDAFNKFQKNHADSSLTIIGVGEERELLERKVADYNISDKVTFTGGMRGEKLVECLNQHRYMLVPSIWQEPFGIVVLEGMACGCVPIVSKSGGLPDAVGEAGLVSERGDVDSLLDKMELLKNNPDLEQQLREKAVKHLQNHNRKAIADFYIRTIQSL